MTSTQQNHSFSVIICADEDIKQSIKDNSVLFLIQLGGIWISIFSDRHSPAPLMTASPIGKKQKTKPEQNT